MDISNVLCATNWSFGTNNMLRMKRFLAYSLVKELDRQHKTDILKLMAFILWILVGIKNHANANSILRVSKLALITRTLTALPML